MLPIKDVRTLNTPAVGGMLERCQKVSKHPSVGGTDNSLISSTACPLVTYCVELLECGPEWLSVVAVCIAVDVWNCRMTFAKILTSRGRWSVRRSANLMRSEMTTETAVLQYTIVNANRNDKFDSWVLFTKKILLTILWAEYTSAGASLGQEMLGGQI